MQVYNFFVCGPKFTIFFFAQRGRVVVDQVFPIFDVWIRSGDIRDQTRKLSEIALSFRRFLPSQILGSGFPEKLCPFEHPRLAARRVKKFRDVIPTSPKVICANTLNFKPNFTCSP